MLRGLGPIGWTSLYIVGIQDLLSQVRHYISSRGEQRGPSPLPSFSDASLEQSLRIYTLLRIDGMDVCYVFITGSRWPSGQHIFQVVPY